jgi:nitroimidazol reductase NimA-like FMN-containing flavoprotein (pyridoxamine 5'-phosphate oxidase superfamily)
MVADEMNTNEEQLLSQPVLARLAAADPATLQPHVVPVWFLWDGEALWISAFSSTRKVKLLMRNPRTAILIEPDHAHPSSLQAILIQGKVEIISQPPEFVRNRSVEIYTHYMGEAGAQGAEPQSWARDPENRLIRLQPEKVNSW